MAIIRVSNWQDKNFSRWESPMWELSGGNFPGGSCLGGNFPGGNFLSGSFPGWELPRWTYPGWEFPLVEVFWVGIVWWESSEWQFLRWEFSCYLNNVILVSLLLTLSRLYTFYLPAVGTGKCALWMQARN